MTKLSVLIPFIVLLAACDQLGIDTPAHQEAEARAIGGGCRHSGQALEDCYISYPKVSKAAIYAGWREMDGYMRDNHIDIVPATLPIPSAKSSKKADAAPASDAPANGSGTASSPASTSDAPNGNAPATSNSDKSS
ncbi:MAG TPA: hypothetical protein VL550_10775 [Rhodocyclaceae bacterium]|jgi:hypothetical protein|nr:hypothetical protein [Rhodocyclaceae bacterium]